MNEQSYPDNLEIISPSQLVKTWMLKFKREVDLKEIDVANADLCMNLIHEERTEVDDEVFDHSGRLRENIDRAALTKELADLIWVCYFAAHKFGLPIDAVFKRVYDSNMSKMGDNGEPLLRDDGKILKGPNYKPAELDDLFESK